MRLFDTSQGEFVDFEPGPVARLYTCGITPYDATHLGHAATYITYDLVHRRLLDLGIEVRLVRNITDIDEDLLQRARRDGINYLDLAFREKRQFDADLSALGNLEPWSQPRATSAIPDIRGIISQLIDLRAAYINDGSVYFRHDASDTFGQVGGYTRVDMRHIGASRGEDPTDDKKRHPLDSLLWGPSASDEPSWESPWGPGRPGWHVECTALARRELGSVDLYGGGCDLIYPHHEFCAAHDRVLSNGDTAVPLYMHQACVHLAGQPMSKSTGNLIFVRDLLKREEPMVVRLAVLSQHYRTQEWTWTDDLLAAARSRIKLWRAAPTGPGPQKEVRALLDKDLSVEEILSLLDARARQGKPVEGAAKLLGVGLRPPPP